MAGSVILAGARTPIGKLLRQSNIDELLTAQWLRRPAPPGRRDEI